jgi:hypothetical protein
MDARHAVLLTPSKCSYPIQLLFYKQNASVSPLFATLTSSLYGSHSIAFSRPLFSYSYELFCNQQSHNSFVCLEFQTLSKKHRDGGVLPLFPFWFTLSVREGITPEPCREETRHSPLITRHFPSSEAHKNSRSCYALRQNAKPAPFFSTACALFCNFLHFFAPFPFPDPLFSIACALFCNSGRRGRVPHLTVGTLRGKMETQKTPRTPRRGQDR